MPHQRDYKAEYARRIANAARRGLTRSQARGHARAGEKQLRPRGVDTSDRQLERGLRALRDQGTLAAAAKQVGVSQERLRRFFRQNSLAERKNRTWLITDTRTREMPVKSAGQSVVRRLRSFEDASLNGRHLAAAEQFIRTNNLDLLAPFVGRFVTDTKGRRHLLETDPNALHRLASAGSEVFHDVYRLIQ